MKHSHEKAMEALSLDLSLVQEHFHVNFIFFSKVLVPVVYSKHIRDHEPGLKQDQGYLTPRSGD